MDNPYQPLQAPLADSEPVPTAPASPYLFRPATLLTPTLRALYALLVPLLPVVAVLTIMLERVDEVTATNQDLLLMMAGVAASLLMVLLLLLTIIVHCVWTNRMNKNARALGARDMDHTPGWAVGYYFIPFVNLIKPFHATSEIYRASRPGRDAVGWKDEPTPAILSGWWAAWIIGNLTDRASDRFLDTEFGGVISLVSATLTAIAGICAFIWIGQVHKRQLQTYSVLASSPEERPADELARV